LIDSYKLFYRLFFFIVQSFGNISQRYFNFQWRLKLPFTSKYLILSSFWDRIWRFLAVKFSINNHSNELFYRKDPGAVEVRQIILGSANSAIHNKFKIRCENKSGMRSDLRAFVFEKKAAAQTNAELGVFGADRLIIIGKGLRRDFRRANMTINFLCDFADRFGTQFFFFIWNSTWGNWYETMTFRRIHLKMLKKKIILWWRQQSSFQWHYPTAMQYCRLIKIGRRNDSSRGTKTSSTLDAGKGFQDVVKIEAYSLWCDSFDTGQEFSGYVAQLDLYIAAWKNFPHLQSLRLEAPHQELAWILQTGYSRSFSGGKKKPHPFRSAFHNLATE